MAIPKHLRPALCKREIRRSLKTTNHSYAVRQARKLAVLTEELFLSGINDKARFETCFKNGINNFPHNVMMLPDNNGYFEEHKIVSCPPFATVTKEPPSTSLTIKELINKYVECQDVENSWQQKTKDENLAIFNTLVEIVGNVQLSELNHQVADNFRATLKNRFGYGAEPFAITLHEDRLILPLQWSRSKIVLVESMGDIFHDDVPDEWLNAVMAITQIAFQHQFLFLTKRASRMSNYFFKNAMKHGSYPSNIWAGISVEDQEAFVKRVPHLGRIFAMNLFLSVEPLLAEISFRAGYDVVKLVDWIICGGETGRHPRDMEPNWARSIQRQCRILDIPFFMKQMSSKDPIPHDLDIQQYPIGLK